MRARKERKKEKAGRDGRREGGRKEEKEGRKETVVNPDVGNMYKGHSYTYNWALMA
jgi:hypothetical protein